MKKTLIIVILCMALGCSVYLYFRQKTTQNNIQGVILISIDSLGAKHLSEYGYAVQTTPNLHRFFDQSYVFLRAVSPASWTIPSHMSIFTSLYPSEHKVVNKFSGFDVPDNTVTVANLKQLTPSAVTLAEILHRHGFATGAFTGDSGVGHQYGFAQGFDTYVDRVPYGGFDTSAPQALDWLAKNKDKKFFLFLHGYDVNEQYTPPEGLDYRYVDKTSAGGSQNQSIQYMRAVYDEKISRADLQFQNFMDHIQKLGLMDTTLIVVFGDHGLEYYEHNRLGAGNTLYGELVDVPLAIHVPGQTEGKNLNSLVSTLDILPTVLKLLNIQNPVPKQVKGIDLTPSFSGADVSGNVFMETDFKLSTHKRAVQTPDGWKFIITMNGPEKELYNLNNDPAEQINLIAKEPQKALELERLVTTHLNDMNAGGGPWILGCPPEFTDQCQ
jgi:arylsulfatase A-like enzyme